MAAPKAEYITVMDPQQLPHAREYAQALLALVPEDDQAEDLWEELKWLVGLLDTVEGFEELLVHAPLSAGQRRAFVERVFSGRVSRVCEGLLVLLAKKNRMPLLRTIVYSYRQRLDRRQRKVQVTVTTPTPLDEGLIEELKKTLKVIVADEPVLKLRVDRKLLGGLTISVGDMFYDASVAGQLHRLEKDLLHKMGLVTTDEM